MKHVQRFLELLSTVQATQTLQPTGEATPSAITSEISADKQQFAAKASRLEFKAVTEM